MDEYKNKKAELRAWAKDDIVPGDLQWLCKTSAEIIEKLQAENEQQADFMALAKEEMDGLRDVIDRCIKAMEGSNCLELEWLKEARKGE